MKAVAFDFDGVLVDSVEADFKTTREAFWQFGVELPLEDYICNWVRHTDLEKYRTDRFIRVKKLKLDAQKVREKKREIFERFWAKAKQIPGSVDFVRLLKKKGLPLAVVSSNYRIYIEKTLERFGILKDFDFIVSIEDCECIKPSPEPYLLAAKKFGFLPAEILAMEDSSPGVESAKSAGCKCIAVKNKYTEKGDFSLADLVVNSFSELSEKDLSKF